MSVPGFEQPISQGADALKVAMDMLGEANARAERAERQRNLVLNAYSTEISARGMRAEFLQDGTFVVEATRQPA